MIKSTSIDYTIGMQLLMQAQSDEPGDWTITVDGVDDKEIDLRDGSGHVVTFTRSYLNNLAGYGILRVVNGEGGQ
jgi:hypothetical protein